jgi:septal ring factor EnvC (AmiA/AmiB activator)
VTQQVPIKAAQRGVIVHAAYLGIYGNCVIIDHGLGVQTLYGHLSSIGVKVGDKVEKGQVIGRSGMTGWLPAITAFHRARQRHSGQPGRVVGLEMDAGSGLPQDHGSRWQRDIIRSLEIHR